ncbi:MAG: protein kinase [Methanomicrobium sp.]|nr:protein kinase [Methanomicrobium sp.]
MRRRDYSAPVCTSADIFMRFLPLFLLTAFIFMAIINPVSAGEVRIGKEIFPTIEEALDFAESDATIIITSGEYSGNIVINKPVSLIGVDSGGGKPVILTATGEAGITVNADGVTIEGFNITGSSDCAILINSDNSIIADNDILKTPVGITLFSSAGTSISGNNIKGHRIGLFIDESVDCSIYLNNFENTINAKSLSRSIRWSTASMIYLYSGQNFTSSLGNYWNDYYGTDDDKNGIGDTPYSPYDSQTGIVSTQNQLFLNSLNLQNLATGGSSYWQNLFYTTNYVTDEYPLIEHNINYNPLAPAGTSTGITEPPGNQQAPGLNNETMPPDMSPPPNTAPEAQWWSGQSPFETVFLMLIISGVSAGLLALAGGFGTLYPVRRTRRAELFFFKGGYFAIAIALLYTIISYTSKLIYNFVDFGYIQIVFILMTAFLISSSGILSLGLIQSKIPLFLNRMHPVFAALTTIMFFISIYTAPLDLGPITSVAYPAALILSIFLPLVFSYLFKDSESQWKNNSGSRYRTRVMPPEQDSTVMFPDEDKIMASGLGSSYFPDSLNERYQDVEFIGKGGIARVFKAKRRTDGKVVAVKVPINFDETTGRLFMKEMRIWEDLSHQNIVKLYSVNILPVPFVEMEYVSKAISDLDLPLSQREAFDIVYGIAKGLLYAHNMHIIHRDIKPQNILITEDKIPKITDWGLGKIMGDGNETTTIGFSLNYAAPEQIAPKKFGRPDERTDIYQMGILFYEILVGKRPFFGVGVAEMSDEILYRTPMKPSENREKDFIFDDIIMKMLSKNPDERYKNIDELIESLDKTKKMIDD